MNQMILHAEPNTELSLIQTIFTLMYTKFMNYTQ